MTCAHCQERPAVLHWGQFTLCEHCYAPLHLAAFDGLLTPEGIYQRSVEWESANLSPEERAGPCVGGLAIW